MDHWSPSEHVNAQVHRFTHSPIHRFAADYCFGALSSASFSSALVTSDLCALPSLSNLCCRRRFASANSSSALSRFASAFCSASVDCASAVFATSNSCLVLSPDATRDSCSATVPLV